jgi:hypothetical protein
VGAEQYGALSVALQVRYYIAQRLLLARIIRHAAVLTLHLRSVLR